MQSIHVFIISWLGQHLNAVAIADSISSVVDKVTIVYSDPNPDFHLAINKFNLIKRPNDFFWEDKFKACLDACDSELLMVIHADTHCMDWKYLVEKCRKEMIVNQLLGVWSPLVKNSSYPLNRTYIASINNTSLHIAAQSDGIIFCLSKNIVLRMQQAEYGNNRYGWGIDWLFIVATYASGKVAVVDQSIEIEHNPSRGYDDSSAYEDMMNFLNKNLNIQEVAQYILLQSHIQNSKLRNPMPS